ncbi:MAG TPA: ATP-binding protein [Ktedonosporobacter sp.]|nr:ATP-binding protein [Ktedonosporobacter sp.]
MTRSKKQPQEPPLSALLQEVQKRAGTEKLTNEQQQHVIQVLLQILQAFASKTAVPERARDIQQIRGQAHVKRALEVAAAGQHHILLVGPPGTGKALLARTLPSLLPIASLPHPLREPSADSGSNAFFGDATLPGELILAQGGVLFLKNLDTFDLSLLTALAQMVETRTIAVPPHEENVLLPTRFILEATIKPCPCGFVGDPTQKCICSAEEIARYRQPLKEIVRTCFAIEVEVPLLVPEILSVFPEESSDDIRARVAAARAIQQKRYAGQPHLQVNADLSTVDEVQQYCQIDSAGEQLLTSALQQLKLTALQMLRLQTVARTIADLAGSPAITARYLAEAIQYLSRFAR